MEEVIEIGDTIAFEPLQSTITVQGRVEVVGKYGYWVNSTSGAVGSGSIRCDFNRARLIKKASDRRPF